MISFLKKVLGDKRGNTLAIAAAAFPLVIGAAGLATDTIQWTLWKRQLQRAADSAAIAGVYDRESANGSTANTTAAVSHDLTLNLHTFYSLKSGYPTVSFPANSGVLTNQVSVTVAIQQPLAFSSFFMSTAPTIIANATAASVPAGGDACVQALEPTATPGIIINGNAGIYMPDCVMYSMSPASNSAYAKGSADVTAEAVAAVGGIQESNNWTVGAYRPYSPPLRDPFANVTPKPSDMNCTTDALDEKTDLTSLPSGTNCFSSLSVGANKSLTLPAGTYYINGGGAKIQGNLNCISCTIVLTNKDPASTTIGEFDVNADAKLNLTAPTSGDFKGIAVYQDRRAQDGGSGNKINGNSSSVITGALYFPSQELQYNGTGNTTAVCTMFVARRVNFTGNAGVTNKFKKLADCAAAGLPSSATIRMVRLVA